MQRLFVGFSLLALLTSQAGNAAKVSRTYPCHRLSAPPIVDGEVRNDPAWMSLPVVTGFSVLGSSFTLAKQTEVQACWDADALYLGFVCEEPDVDMMKFSIADGGDAWLDDGVEIFLQPGGAGHQVYQLIVTARGKRSGFEGAPDFTKLQAAALKGDGCYSLETRIPHSLMETSPAVGMRWRGNFCRNIFTMKSGGDRFTSWAPLKTRFLEPDNFGELAFMGAPPARESLQKLNDRLNGPYRRSLIAKVVSAARKAPEYEAALKEAAQDAEYGKAAMDLADRWQRVERAAGEAGKTEITELRTAAVDAGSLENASCRFKYTYLIYRLLEEN